MFGDDTDSALQSAAALVNTEPLASQSDEDELTGVGEVTAFFDRLGYSGRLDGSEAELAALRALRTELRAFFTEAREEVAAHVNRVLEEEHAQPVLVRHDGLDWHLHAVPDDAPFATRVRVETAMAMSDVVRLDQTDRLGECAAEGCTALIVDLSRNRSRRFCDGTCGNRTNVAAYRQRRATAIG